MSRREEYAEATRQAVLAAARRLFAERGYFATRVDDIASLARVAPATVYAACGGKQGLLATLMDIWTTAPIVAATISRAEELDDPAAIIHLVAQSCRKMREDYGDIIRVLRTTAAHDQFVDRSLAIATARYRQSFVPVSRRLMALGALREGLDLDLAVDIFWFYFGYSGFQVLHYENGWSFERAADWLDAEASRALLREAALRPSDQTGGGRVPVPAAAAKGPE